MPDAKVERQMTTGLPVSSHYSSKTFKLVLMRCMYERDERNKLLLLLL